MKRNIVTSLISLVAVFCLAGLSAHAQLRPQENWMEKIQTVKIAFLTNEIGLTPTEAQSFWPIYNAVSEELDKAMYSAAASYMELEKAIKENKSEKEINKCLDRYLEAMSSQDEIRNESVAKYRKILPDTKVAKVFVAEEKFRRQHIRTLQRTPVRPQQN